MEVRAELLPRWLRIIGELRRQSTHIAKGGDGP
jgi:hypothetical protein